MKKILISIVLLLSLTACGDASDQGSLSSENRSNETESETNHDNSYDTIELDDINDYVEQGYIVADVREMDEFESGHIPGAINAPLSALQAGDYTSLDSENKYVIICRSGNRSVIASDILIEEGYQIVNVREGMSTWHGEIEQ